MKFKKLISSSLIAGILFNAFLPSFASTISEDRRYETFEDSNIAIKNVLKEDIVDVEIEGNTLVNLYDSNTLNESSSVSKFNNGFKFVVTNPKAEGTWEYQSFKKPVYKDNTTYTFIINIRKNTFPDMAIFRLFRPESTNGSGYFIRGGKTGLLKCTITTNSTNASDWGSDYTNFGFRMDNAGELVVEDIMLLEGDWSDKEIPKYFKGMKSVGQNNDNNHRIEIFSKNKNLWNADEVRTQSGSKPLFVKNNNIITYTNIGEYGVYITFEAKKGEILKISGIIKNVQNIRIFRESDKFQGMGIYNRNYDGIETEVSPNYSVTIPQDGVYHIRVWCKNTGQATLTNFLAEISDKNTAYIESDLNKKEVLLSEPLRKIPNGAKDEIVKINNKWFVKRMCKEVIINGDTPISGYYTTNINEDMIVPYYSDESYKTYSYAFCEPLPFFKYPDEKNHIGIIESVTVGSGGGGAVFITLKKDRVKNISLQEYLNDNPVRCVVELKTPIFEPLEIDSILNLYTETTHIYNNSVIPANMKVTVDRILNRAIESVELVKTNPTAENLSLARMWVNLIDDSILKDQLQDEINSITNIDDLQLERKSASSNLDIYVKSENMLSLSLNTNSIIFDDYSGVEDMEMLGAVNISINSSLPYSLNAYMPSEIANSDKSETMPIDILNIRENSECVYQRFNNTTDKIVLKDNCSNGNDLIHNIDLKLSTNLAHRADVYKTVIKFEAEQK